MWCLLGDATGDLSCYDIALELSGDKCAKAYGSLGMHHYMKKEFKECVPLFQKSLDRNSIQPEIWLRLASAAMKLEMWELGAQSYRSYCSYEMDSFDAWNNLAKCYIKLDMKEVAWRVLQEALRCDYGNCKVWDNLMVIATDIAKGNLKTVTIKNRKEIETKEFKTLLEPWPPKMHEELERLLEVSLELNNKDPP